MKPLYHNVIVYTGLLLSVITPVQGKTPNLIVTPLGSTDTLPTEVLTENSQSIEYQSAYVQGRREAEDTIMMGKPSIYTVGLHRPDSSAMDQQTGLPLVSIGGCVVNDTIIGRMNGYNNRIREWVAQQPGNSSSSTSFEQDNSQEPALLSSGIEGRSILRTMPGIVPVGVDRIEPIIYPSQVTISVFDQRGNKVSRIQPDTEGNFRLMLKPGTYRLQPDLPKSDPGASFFMDNEEQIVTVKADQFTFLTFNYTTFAP